MVVQRVREWGSLRDAFPGHKTASGEIGVDKRMPKIGRALIILLTLAAAIGVSILDVVTGLRPDISILYLIPVIAGAVFVSFRYGLLVAAVAAAAELFFHIELGAGHGARLYLDVLFHFSVFVLGAVLISRLIIQLRTIAELEQIRTRDLNIAKEVHRSVFAPVPTHYGNLVIGAKLTFARELGGDYYHFAETEDGLVFFIADISGKSVAAALFSALLNDVVIDALEHSTDLATIFATVNSRISTTLPENMFVTMFCAFINEEAIRFINAGHEPALLFSKKDGTVKLLESQMTLPIGVQPDLKIEPSVESFVSGDVLLAVTDGVTESEAFKEKPLEKLKILVRENSDSDPQEIANLVYARAAVGASENLPDDIVITCVKRG